MVNLRLDEEMKVCLPIKETLFRNILKKISRLNEKEWIELLGNVLFCTLLKIETTKSYLNIASCLTDVLLIFYSFVALL